MKTTFRSTLSAAILLSATLLQAQSPDTAAAKTSGKILVLDNERTLEGEIETHGGQYRVRRSAGELWIQSENVLKLCQTREEAYEFLRKRANLRDPDEHMRLARWCQTNGLRKQALDEVTAAVNLRPEHAEGQRLLRSLQRAATAMPATTAFKPVADTDSALAVPQVNNETLSLFVTKVQPILMNACANCHATGRGGAFKLTRTFESSAGGSRSTQLNLSAALGQLTTKTTSPLLTKAISVHGDMTFPAFKSRETQAYLTLEEWVRLALETNAGLNAPAAVATVAAASGPTAFGTGVKEVENAKPSMPQQLPASVTAEKDSKELTPTGNGPADAYDPAIFNRQMHPQAKAGGPK